MTDGFDGDIGSLQDYIDDHHNFLAWLDTGVEALEPGRIVMSIPYDGKLTNALPDASADRRPEVHGGVAATLADTAGGLALRTELDDPVEEDVATISLNVNYLERATGDLTATGEVVRAGGTVGASGITVESDTPEGTRTVATAQGAYRLFRSDR